jgi:hypothetical protein
VNEKKAGETEDRRGGDRRKGPGEPVPPEQERRKSNRRAGDGGQAADA